MVIEIQEMDNYTMDIQITKYMNKLYKTKYYTITYLIIAIHPI